MFRHKRNAGVAELADAQDLKSCGVKSVPVRFRSPALNLIAVVLQLRLNYFYVSVAQLDRALGYGPRCREFESSHSRFELYISDYSEMFFFRKIPEENFLYKKTLR